MYEDFVNFNIMKNHTNRPVVQKGGFAIYEKDKKAFLVNHKIGGLITMTFVLIILTPILMVAGEEEILWKYFHLMDWSEGQ